MVSRFPVRAAVEHGGANFLRWLARRQSVWDVQWKPGGPDSGSDDSHRPPPARSQYRCGDWNAALEFIFKLQRLATSPGKTLFQRLAIRGGLHIQPRPG